MNPQVTLEIENLGNIVMELYPDVAPNTVNNFLDLAAKGFYDGVIFHRVIDGFVIQGGDPTGTGMGGPGYAIKGEFSTNGHRNTLKHSFGILSMARSMSKDSAGSQFFIMLGASPHLDGEYAGFGKVIEGDEIVEKIGKCETNFQDRPTSDIKILKATVDTFGLEYPEPSKI